MNRGEAYYRGRDDKAAEIHEMGYDAAVAKFNADHPIGKRGRPAKTYSVDGWQYVNGELDALLEAVKQERDAGGAA